MRTLNTVYVLSEDAVAREIEGDLIIVPLTANIGDADDELYTLNETGRAIWQKLDGRHTVSEIAAELAAEFEAPEETIQADVRGFLDEMVRRRLLVVVSAEHVSAKC